MIGVGRHDNAEDVNKVFEDDMKRYGAGVADEESRYYRKVLDAVYTDLQKSTQREANLTEERKQLAANLKAMEEAKETQVAEAQKAMNQAKAELASLTNTFKQDREELERNKKELMDKVESQKNEFESKVAQRDTQIKQMEEKIAKLERANKNLIEQRKDEPGSFEVADGRISWVNQNGTVWINLGSADALRRQVTFSVFDADQHDAEKATKKGSIEVTRILGDHMAEARVTDDDPTNPILTGDLIYSQIWHRGKKLRFALTGIIDFDGDDQSDMQLARELIELNGGEVDAYMKEDGEVEGEITANTRYLIHGDFPELASQVKLQPAWTRMNQEASSLGVESITLTEFLNQMGYKPQDRTVQLGAGAKASDFPARPENGTPSAGAAPRFRPRTPYRTQATTQ